MAANELSGRRASLTATPLPDGRVLLAGGQGADLFDLADLSMTKLPPMLASRAGHTATLLPAGSKACGGSCVFLAGGCQRRPYLGDLRRRLALVRPARECAGAAQSIARSSGGCIAGRRPRLESRAERLELNPLKPASSSTARAFVPGPVLQAPRTGAASAWLPALNLLLLAGGGTLPELLAAP